MYKTKPCGTCAMPAPDMALNVLVLNASLKHARDVSNTGELAELVPENLRDQHANLTTGFVRLAKLDLPVAADIVLFATPTWWGGRSSLMQRVIERMDALDEESECAAYWVGGLGQPTAKDREKRLVNDARKHMAKNFARNTLYDSQLLQQKPLVPANA